MMNALGEVNHTALNDPEAPADLMMSCADDHSVRCALDAPSRARCPCPVHAANLDLLSYPVAGAFQHCEFCFLSEIDQAIVRPSHALTFFGQPQTHPVSLTLPSDLPLGGTTGAHGLKTASLMDGSDSDQLFAPRYQYTITLPAEISAAALVVQFWTNVADINVGVWISVFIVSICSFNFLGVVSCVPFGRLA